jgi:hypothetical protein
MELKFKSGTVTIERSFTTATYDYIQETSTYNNRITLMYSSSKNWQTPGKIAVSLAETNEDLLLVGLGIHSFSIPRRLVEPLRIALHLEEKLNAVSSMDKIKVHQEIK